MLTPTIQHRHARAAWRAAVFGVSVAFLACERPAGPETARTTIEPHFTMGQGSTPTTIGQATFADFDKVKRIEKDWHVDLKAKGGLEVIVRSFAYQPGAFTGWHKHPGPVLIQVIEGTVTFFEANAPCTPIVVPAGQGYIDTGTGHIGRNLSTVQPAKDVTIFLAPPGTQISQLRIDMDAPPGAEACGND